ncbi:DUF1648 domain-containing protein [Streptomyces sp. NPDC058953]|uniref:DUF1648 domain-containing protein n=1 Tax=unclassified Streptomyces TaxID=2593676 RepID=UPI0036A121EB
MRRPAAPEEIPATARARRWWIAVAPTVLAVAVFLAVYLSVRDRLPGELATHMGGDGRADDFTGRGAFTVTALLSLAGLGTLFAVLSRFTSDAKQASAPRALLATGAGTVALVGYLLVLLLLANAGVGDPATVRFSDWHIAGAAAAGGAAGALAWFAAGPDPLAAAPDEASSAAGRLPLGPGEQIAWTRTVTAPGLLVAGGLTVAALAAAAVYAGGWLLASAIPLGFLFAATGRVRVTADSQGLTVTPAGLRRPRVRIPLDQIAAATTRPVSPVRDFGGWGYRVRAGASGLILRSGDALAVGKASGGTFLVTVDDATTAAATLNALADRAHRAA